MNSDITPCVCGCGQPAPIAKMTIRRRGHVAGQPLRFVRGHNKRLRKRRSGYRSVMRQEHPRAGADSYIDEHILIAERALGHHLPAGAEVHHVDGNTLNNANANIVICQDLAYHKLLHVRARVVLAGGDPNSQRVCGMCKHLKAFAEFNRNASNKNCGLDRRCRTCAREYNRKRNQASKGRAA